MITGHSTNTTPADAHSCKSSWNVCRQVLPGRPVLLLSPSGTYSTAYSHACRSIYRLTYDDIFKVEESAYRVVEYTGWLRIAAVATLIHAMLYNAWRHHNKQMTDWLYKICSITGEKTSAHCTGLMAVYSSYLIWFHISV